MLNIDGIEVQAPEEATLLEAARESGIEIPTLCHHESLGPEGRCRLCMVELQRGQRTRLVASCLYPVEEGLRVQTRSEKVLRTRKIVLELLLARCPDAKEIRTLAAEAGIEQPRFKPDEGKGTCILCGMCVKACEQAVGASAIGLSQRGSEKKVGTPFLEPALACIGCGACHFVCPTGAIDMSEEKGVRRIWGRDFALQACRVCGNYFAPEYQLEWMSKKSGVPMDFFRTCQNCRP